LCLLLGPRFPSSWKFTGKKNLPRKFCFPGKEAFSILPYLVFTQQILFDIIFQEYNLGFFRFQPSLSGAVNLCPAPNLSLTDGSASDVFRVIDSSVYKNVKAREAFKPHACVQLLLQLSLSLSLARRSVTPGMHCRIMLLVILLSSCGNAI
jgi:hypothetical protein